MEIDISKNSIQARNGATNGVTVDHEGISINIHDTNNHENVHRTTTEQNYLQTNPKELSPELQPYQQFNSAGIGCDQVPAAI